MADASRKENPLIVTQRPSRAELHHQASVESSDEEQQEWRDPPASPSSLPHPSSPSRAATLPQPSSHSPHDLPAVHLPPEEEEEKKKKKKKRRFLFRRKKKGRTGSLKAPSLGSRDALSSLDSDSGTSFTDILMDPSLVHRKGSGNRLMSLPNETLQRSVSDSAVHRVGLEIGVEEEREEGERAGPPQSWLVHITLKSGHGLAIRDRTGTSDPYVKFKCGQFKYRSTIVNRNLNPEWNEAFSFISSQLHLPLEVHVYDHDYGSLDDYMGGGTVLLEAYTRGELHIVDIGLQDPNAREKSLGFIRLFLCISPHADERGQPESAVSQSIQVWNSVLTIHLLKGMNLPAMDDNGFSDPYCKFKLGRQKRRSKVVTRCLNPHWKEQFDLRMYHGDSTTLHIEVWDRDLLQSDDFIGETCVELHTLTQEQTHDLTLPLQGDSSGDCGSIHLLLTITGTTAQEVDRDSASANRSSWSATELKELMQKYMISRSLSFSLWNDIGHVSVIIDRLEGLGKSADVFVIAEVGNSQARTHTVYKTTAPFWGKAFHFDVRDVHSTLEVSVYSAKSKPELIGRTKVPLLRLELGVNKGYVLKNKRCLEATQGVLYLKCDFVYQPVRAALRTLKPRECKLMEKEAPFQRKVLMHNIKRITALINDLSAGMAGIRHIYNWENKLHSTLTLLVFIVVCLVVELWMVPLVLAVMFLVQYGLVYGKGRHLWQQRAKRRSSASSSELVIGQPLAEVDGEWSDLEDDLEEGGGGGGGGGKKNIRHKFRQIQGILLIVQNVLGEIADTGERINNLLTWKVPFLCWLCIVIFCVGFIVTLIIPLRYIILVWGVGKLTKKLRRPNYIPNNELRDLISCAPTHNNLLEYRELPIRRISQNLATSGGHTSSKRPRSRSPQLRPRTQSNPQMKVKKAHTTAT